MQRYTKLTNIIKRPELYIAIIAVILRILLSDALKIWGEGSAYDGGFFISSVHYNEDFEYSPQFALIKNAAFILFLQFVDFTGLSYDLVLSLVWIGASFLTVKTFKYLTDNRFFLTFAFLFVMFTPAAFDGWIGTRLYRNSIIAPFVLIVFLLMLCVFFRVVGQPKAKAKKMLIANVFLGVFFSFAYYIKEDGMWLLACILGCAFVCVIILLFRYISEKIKAKKGMINTNSYKSSDLIKQIIVLCLPFLIFCGFTNLYKAINYYNHGVYEVNTRTEGELARYVDLVYEIQSPIRTKTNWAPSDAIDRTYEVSETFHRYPQIIENIRNSGGGIYENQIKGDFLTWNLRDAISGAGLWKSEAYVQNIFKNINDEIERAFETGEIKNDEKFKLVSSTGGYDINEIFSLFETIKAEFATHILLENYYPGGMIMLDCNSSQAREMRIAEDITNMPLIWANNESVQQVQQNAVQANKAVGGIFNVYSVINPILISCAITGAVISFIYLFIMRVKKRKNENRYLGAVIFMTVILNIICGVYAFAIAWFTDFISVNADYNFYLVVVKFYSVGLVPMLSIIELFGAYYVTQLALYCRKRFKLLKKQITI